MNKKPIVLVVMDGVGKTDKDLGNMVMHAYTPTLDEMMRTCPNNTIQAHGTARGSAPPMRIWATARWATTPWAAARSTRRAQSW